MDTVPCVHRQRTPRNPSNEVRFKASTEQLRFDRDVLDKLRQHEERANHKNHSIQNDCCLGQLTMRLQSFDVDEHGKCHHVHNGSEGANVPNDVPWMRVDRRDERAEHEEGHVKENEPSVAKPIRPHHRVKELDADDTYQNRVHEEDLRRESNAADESGH